MAIISTQLSSAVCDHYRHHAFLNNDRCRDCGHTLAEHSSHIKSPINNKSFDPHTVTALLYSNSECTHFSGHYWLWNRCRDCARSEGVHTTTDGQQPHLTNQYNTWITYSGSTPINLDELTTAGLCDVKISQLQHEITSVNEDYTKLNDMQLKLLAAHKLTQHELDGRLLLLSDVHVKKLNDLNGGILCVQQHQQQLIDHANTVKTLDQYQEHKQQETIIEPMLDKTDIDTHNTISEIIDGVIANAVLNADASLLIHGDDELKQCELSNEELHELARAEAANNWAQLPEDEWHIRVGDMTIEQLSQRSSFVTRVEKVMQSGRNMIRFTSINNKPQFISLFIRQLPGTTQYTLYWAPAHMRTVSTTRSIQFSDIQCVVLGNQSTTQQLKKPIFDSVDSHCFSIIGSHSSLHLQCGTQKERDIWAYGLQRLIACKTGDNKLFHVQLFTSNQYKETRDRVTIERAGEMNESGELIDDANNDDLLSIQRRDIGKQYSVGLSVRGDRLQLASQYNNYIVCAIGRNNKTDQPEYLCQTDRAGQDQLFNNQLTIVYEDNSRTGRPHKYRLNVYDVPMTAGTIEDDYRIGSCILEYNQINQPVNTTLPLKLHHKDATKNALLNDCMLHVTIASRSEIPLVTPFTWPPRVVDKFMDALSFGSTVTLYSTPDKSHRVTLFYRVNKSLDASKVPDVGTVYYVPVGRELSEEKKWSLPVHRITDVYRGRRSDNYPVTVDDTLCVSFVIDNGKRLDIVCDNNEQRDLWVGGIVNILNAARSFKKRLPL